MGEEGSVKCRRPGCGKAFTPSSNNDDACKYHTMLPVFHDGVKQWPCCGQEAWDWDAFMKIEGCAVGPHSDVPPQQPAAAAAAAAPKPAAAAAAPAAEAQTAPRSIEEFNKQQQQQQQEKQQQQQQQQQEEVPWVSPEGQHKCIHKGCSKTYKPEENTDTACSYHPGDPTFRDGCKSWSCCGGRAYDWDDFLKLPTCTTGPHAPKMVVPQ